MDQKHGSHRTGGDPGLLAIDHIFVAIAEAKVFITPVIHRKANDIALASDSQWALAKMKMRVIHILGNKLILDPDYYRSPLPAVRRN